jgi:hypothetical protein
VPVGESGLRVEVAKGMRVEEGSEWSSGEVQEVRRMRKVERRRRKTESGDRSNRR